MKLLVAMRGIWFVYPTIIIYIIHNNIYIIHSIKIYVYIYIYIYIHIYMHTVNYHKQKND